jgi:hypothetical protein
VLSTVVTGWAISRLPGAACGWGHLPIAPLYIILCFLQFLVLVFPWHP